MRKDQTRARFLLEEMVRHSEVIASCVAHGRDAFESDSAVRYAVEHAVELLSEASKKVGAEVQRLNPKIPWKDLQAIRREIAHPYDPGALSFDPNRLWRFASGDMPRLVRRLRRPVLPKE